MRLIGYALLIFVLLSLVVIGFALQKSLSKKISLINSFEMCAKKGFPILETYPRQCKRPDGITFTEKISE